MLAHQPSLQPAVAHHQPPVLTDNAAAVGSMTPTILALQFALQSAQAARDEELRRPAGGQSACNGNFNDGDQWEDRTREYASWVTNGRTEHGNGCYSWTLSGSSAPFLPNSR